MVLFNTSVSLGERFVSGGTLSNPIVQSVLIIERLFCHFNTETADSSLVKGTVFGGAVKKEYSEPKLSFGSEYSFGFQTLGLARSPDQACVWPYPVPRM